MNDHKNDEMNDRFAQQARETLQQSERQLNSRTRAKLSAARRAALEQSTRDSNNWLFGRGAPVWGALTAAAIVAVIVLRPNIPLTNQSSATTAAVNTEAENLSAEQELDLYENLELLELYEDLEFYEWLADEVPEEIAS